VEELKRAARRLDIHEDSGDSDEEFEDGDELNSPVHRKKRGLKILSVKVRELVEKKGSTTYKDVANELIKQLREDKKNRDDLSGLEDSYEDDEELTEDSPDKKLNSGSKSEQT
jgi:hypothetical protein